MSHRIFFNPDTEIIQATLEGVMNFNEVKEVISEATTLAKENKCYLWLIDYSQVSPHFSTREIYELPSLFFKAADLLNIHVIHIKRAIVISKEHADYEFAKTVSLNRGQSYELFYDVEQATNWLKNK